MLLEFFQPKDETLDGGWKLFYFGADPSNSAQAGVGIIKAPG